MKKKCFTEQHILGFLKEAEARMPVKSREGRTASVIRPSKAGGRSSADCKSTNPSGCASLKR